MTTARKKPRPDAIQINRTRSLRRQSTVPEQRLWSILRGRRLGGLKFKRQQAIGPYVVDFYCAQVNLVVELDGLSHVGRASYDSQRSEYLQQLGLTVLRVTNDDALQAEEAVAVAIARATGLPW